jgi:holliday junction DNA helicase RuvA
MIGYLKGQLLSAQDGELILGIGGSPGGSIGYGIRVPRRPIYQGLLPGQEAEFFIYTHVREDALELFGFITPAEKELFLVLTSVSGIGPKSGLGILSSSEPAALLEQITRGDSAALTLLPGIGKKTAERIVLELSDTLKKRVQAGDFSQLVAPSRSGTPASSARFAGAHSAALEKTLSDAREALVGLGYRESDAIRALNEALASEQPPQSVEAMVRAVLKMQVL